MIIFLDCEAFSPHQAAEDGILPETEPETEPETPLGRLRLMEWACTPLTGGSQTSYPRLRRSGDRRSARAEIRAKALGLRNLLSNRRRRTHPGSARRLSFPPRALDTSEHPSSISGVPRRTERPTACQGSLRFHRQREGHRAQSGAGPSLHGGDW